MKSLCFMSFLMVMVSENLILCETPVFIFKRYKPNEFEFSKLLITDNNITAQAGNVVRIESRRIIDIDFGIEDNSVFLLHSNRILRVIMNQEFYQILDSKSIIDAKNLYSMSYDWIHRLIYFTVRNEIQIRVINIDDISSQFVLNVTTSGNSKLAVNPIDMFILWTNDKQVIKANLDGSESTVLYESDRYVGYITIDFESKSICFHSNRKVLLIDFSGHIISTLDTPFGAIEGLDIYRNLVFIRNGYKVFTLNRELNNLVSELKSNVTVFRLIHSSRQPENASNVCVESKCSNLCIPRTNNEYRCVCPINAVNNVSQCIESIVTITEDDSTTTVTNTKDDSITIAINNNDDSVTIITNAEDDDDDHDHDSTTKIASSSQQANSLHIFIIIFVVVIL